MVLDVILATAASTATTAEPWFEPALAGALGGAGVGILGGIYGTLAGILVPRGAARRFMFGLHYAAIGLGVAMLAAGITAIVSGQPYGVWFGLTLPGVLLCGVMLLFTPVLRMQYRAAEHRRLEAQEFRGN